MGTLFQLRKAGRLFAAGVAALALSLAAPLARAQAVVDMQLSPPLDASVCNGGQPASFDEQAVVPDATGQFNDVWSLTTPVLGVVGYIDDYIVDATLFCLGGGATGHLHATRSPGEPQYIGSFTFDGESGTLIAMPRGATLFVDDVSIEEGDEGSTDAIFTVTLSVATTQPITFSVATTDLTAEAGSDYEATSLTLETIAPGELTHTFAVPVFGDNDLEDDETFEVRLADVVGGASVTRGVGYGLIVDDERPLLSISDATLVEGTGGSKFATFSLTLSEISQQAVTYDIATVAGTAKADADFIAASATGLGIPAGALRRTFTVAIVGDNVIEAAESFTVVLANVEGARLRQGEEVGIGTILNDDWPLLSIGDVTLVEGTGGSRQATFILRLDRISPFPVGFSVATANGTAQAGVDYGSAAFSGQTFAPGSLARYFTVSVAADGAIEFDETFKAQLGNVTGAILADGTGVATVVNDDWPALSIADLTLAEGHSGTRIANVIVRLDRAAPFAVRYDIRTANATASAGSDYVARALTGQTIPAFALSRTFAVTVNGDLAVENDESFDVKAGNVAFATVLDGAGRVTLRNDDQASVSVSDFALAEGDSGTKLATFTVRLDKAVPWPVTYAIATADGSALAGSDYQASTLSGQAIPAGALARVFTATVYGDVAAEPDETFSVEVSGVVGANVADAQGMGTIRNDDTP